MAASGLRAVARGVTSADDRAGWALASSVATDGLWYWDVRRRAVRVTPRTEELLGYAADELGRRPADLLARVDAGDQKRLRRALRPLLIGRRTGLEIELRVLTRGGQRRWCVLRARARRDADGRARLIGGSIVDIDARKDRKSVV